MILLSLALALAPAPNLSLASLQATPAPAQAENRFYGVLRQRGVSPAGLATIARNDAAGATESRRIESSLIAVNREVAAIVDGQVDVDRLADALGRREAIIAQQRTFRTRALLTVLRALTPADRAIVARNVGLPTMRPQAQ